MADFAKEGGHFYLPSGEPFYTVPNKSKPGDERPAKTTDAIKVGAAPSVTTVIKAAAAPALVKYFINQALDSAITLPRLAGESADDFKARALLDSQEHAKQARERGVQIHGAIEQFCRKEPVDPDLIPYCLNVRDELLKTGIDIHSVKPERSFCVAGQYGGKVDLHGDGWVLDYKGVDENKIDGKLGYDENIWQLSAYRAGLGMPTARLISVFISRTTGRVKLKEWPEEDAVQAYAEFLALLKFYRLTKGFDKP